MPPDEPGDPPTDRLRGLFYLRETRHDDDRIVYIGESLVPEKVLMRELGPDFHEAGYELSLSRRSATDEVALVAEPRSVGIDGVPWLNIGLFVATVVSTLLVGAVGWFYVPTETIAENPLAVLRAWPFTAAVLGVLLTHELGHYVVARYHGVDVSLPYVIPFVLPFGTLGAIIRMRGRMPDRRALFDIGVAGPLAGLAATIVVTVIGLVLPPIQVPPSVTTAGGPVIIFHDPPLLELIAGALGRPTSYGDPGLMVHPVVLGGWIGMFFTVLNLLPVGQLDGGHIVRAMLGERQETVAAVVPLALFGLAGYLYAVRDLSLNDSVGLWAVWGVFAAVIAYRGPATPADETPLGWKRLVVGALTFGLGALCFILVPVQLVGA